jgi:hypothetical protein
VYPGHHERHKRDGPYAGIMTGANPHDHVGRKSESNGAADREIRTHSEGQ